MGELTYRFAGRRNGGDLGQWRECGQVGKEGHLGSPIEFDLSWLWGRRRERRRGGGEGRRKGRRGKARGRVRGWRWRWRVGC